MNGSVPDYVVGDAYRLRQVILNLVGNAIKFTEHGEIKVSIQRSAPSTDTECTYEFTVSDTGIGIEENKLGLIFDKFQQADGSMTRRFGGTGLGLAISKRLVRLMGCDIWVTSNVGRGSTFHFTCTVKLVKIPLSVTDQLVPYRNRRILFVDKGCSKDQPIRGMLIELGLEPLVIDCEDRILSERLQDQLGYIFDAILVESIDTAARLRDSGALRSIPLVLLAPEVTVGLKSAIDLGIAS